MRVKRPNKLKCIRDFCLGCAGDSPKEVTLCHLSDCPLWEFRTGSHISSPVYKKRFRGAVERNPEDVRELLAEDGKDPVFVRICDAIKHSGAKLG
jgi:hypothetical protein